MQFEVPVRGCTLAEDGSSLLATSGKGYLLRYRADPRLPRRDRWDHPSGSDESDEDCAEAVDLAAEQVGGVLVLVWRCWCSTRGH